MSNTTKKKQPIEVESGEPKYKVSDEESPNEALLNNDDAPQQFHLSVYLIMLILGLGLLTPWNIVLNA